MSADTENSKINNAASIRLFGRRRREFLLSLYHTIGDAAIFGRGAEAAFYFSFSIFPLLFFLISIIGIALGTSDGLRTELFGYLGRLMPETAFSVVRSTLEEIIAASTPGKITFGLAVTLWSASAGIDGIRNGLNSVYGLCETRPWWRTKLRSIIITFLMLLIAAAAIAFVFYGLQITRSALASIGMPIDSPLVLTLIRWLALIVLMLFAFEVIFNLIPNWGRLRWVWLTPGSLAAIALWILVSAAFRFYLDRFDTYDRAYGSLGAVMLLVLWLYLMAVIVLIGGAINSVIEQMRQREPAADRAEANSVSINPASEDLE